MSNRFHKLRCKQYHLTTVIQKELNFDLITILQDLQWVKCDHGVMDSAGLPHVAWEGLIPADHPWRDDPHDVNGWLNAGKNPRATCFLHGNLSGGDQETLSAACKLVFFHVFCCFLLNNVQVDVLTCVIFQSWWRGVGWPNDVRVDVLTCVVFRSSWVSC